LANQDFLRKLPGHADPFSSQMSLAQRLHIDVPLLVLLLALAGYGLVVLYSAGGQNLFYLKRQASILGLAVGVMFVVAQLSPQFIRRWSPLIYAGGVLMLVAVLVVGTGAKGAQRWLVIGGIRFQPSELMKLALPITLAAYFSPRILPPRFKHLFWAVCMIMLPTLLIAVEPDLGTSILIASSGVFVLFLGGLGWRYIFSAMTIGVMLTPIFWFYLLKEYQKTRILTMLNPEDDKLGAGWNIIQSKTAIGSGGIDGKGWTAGTQSQLDFLPESHTDFIIAVLAEEFGLTGVVILLVLYLMIIARGLLIGLQAQDTFGRLLAGSITLTFFVYVFVNVGMVSGMLPVVGVPLPLVSYGGTSVVTLMTGFGILMAISTERKRLLV